MTTLAAPPILATPAVTPAYSLRYFAVNFEIGARHMPIRVCGRSGKCYGTALYRKEWGGHVLELDPKDYEGDPKKPAEWAKAARDIAGTRHRSLSTWVIFAEAVANLESSEGQSLQEIDRLKTELEQAIAERDGYRAEFETLSAAAQPQTEQAPVTEPGNGAPLPVHIADIGPARLPEKEEKPEEEKPDAAPTDLRASLDALGFRELRTLAKEEPALVLTGVTTKDKLVDLLVASGRAPR